MRHYIFLVCILVTPFLVSGCSAVVSTGETTVTNDPYKDIAKVTTSGYKIPQNSVEVFLRAFIPKKNNVSVDTSEVGVSKGGLEDTMYQIYFNMTANDWHFWDETRFNVKGKTKKIGLERLGSDVECGSYGCTHYEDVAGIISRETLESIVEDGGVSFRVYSGKYSDTSQDTQISREEVEDFLNSVDRLRNEVSGGDSTTKEGQ